VAGLGHLPPLPSEPLQALWRYLGRRDQGPPDNAPALLSLGFSQSGSSDILTWAYEQPTGENAKAADGFLLFYGPGATPVPVQSQIKIGPDARSAAVSWPEGGTRSYALAAYRLTQIGLELGPIVQSAAWQGATGSGISPDLSQYLFLPGRAGGQIAHGGVADGEGLTLIGNPAATRQVQGVMIDVDDPANPITLDASSSGGGFYKILSVPSTYHIKCGANAIIQQMLAYEPTIHLDDTASGTYALFLYGSGANIRVANAAAIFILMLCYSGTTVNVEAGGGPMSISIAPGFFGNMHYVLGGGAAGDLTIGEHVEVWSQPQFTNRSTGIGAKTLHATRFLAHMLDPTHDGGGAFDVPANIGLECDDQTIGTVIAAVRSRITAGSGRYFLKDDGGADSVLAGTMDTAGFKTAGTPGIDATVALAKLTALGSDGSATFSKGILTAYTAPT
jgi:hypothetical protein